ncbi:SDR family NAD(P)-dependent oxidoreductase [Pseudonocardia sp.]|uniref:SDR family NAD(P)-dependent oxidoreductase n=1 Tax=Pseudonocardia sp. TaxID=60912 RepID=UPI003D13FEF4
MSITSGLAGSTILIAGSSRGIGAAAARLAAAEGAKVLLHGRSAGPALAGLAEELAAPAITCDGRDAAAVDAAVGRLLADGHAVDGLVCTLGAVSATPALGGSTDGWLDEFRANVLAPAHFIRAVAPGMVERRHGRIVTVSSIRGHDALAHGDVTAYSAAKAALENLTSIYAKELAPHVTVNAVAPGFVLTDMSRTWSPQVREEVGRSLLGRAAEPEEIARLLLVLVSNAASFLTGQTILADGGLLARRT